MFVDKKGLLAAFESSDDGKTPCRLVPGPINEFSGLVSEVLVSLFVALLESLLPPCLLETSSSPHSLLLPPVLLLSDSSSSGANVLSSLT